MQTAEAGIGGEQDVSDGWRNDLIEWCDTDPSHLANKTLFCSAKEA